MAFTSKQKDRQVIYLTELELADLSEKFKEKLQKSVFEVRYCFLYFSRSQLRITEEERATNRTIKLIRYRTEWQKQLETIYRPAKNKKNQGTTKRKGQLVIEAKEIIKRN